MSDSITVIGIEKVEASLRAGFWDAFGPALDLGAHAIAAEMRHAAKRHHDTGNLERNIHANPVEKVGNELHARIGISTAAAPEGRPLAFGWLSKSGKQPPTEAIMKWLIRKGRLDVARRKRGVQGPMQFGGRPDAQLRSRAFLIARSIKRRGYSFGADNWFAKGIAAGRPKLRAILRNAMRKGQG